MLVIETREGLHSDLALPECRHQLLQGDVLLLQLRVILEQPGLSEFILLDFFPHPAPLKLQRLVGLQQSEDMMGRKEGPRQGKRIRSSQPQSLLETVVVSLQQDRTIFRLMKKESILDQNMSIC